MGKRKTLEEIKAQRATAALTLKKKRKTVRKEQFKRAEKYVKEYRDNEKSMIRMKRQAKNAGNFFIEPAAKVLLVVHIRGINRTSPKTQKILQLLRLRQIHNAVFLKVNHATMTMLKYVEPYVTYGKVNKQRIPLTENSIIEKSLGTKNIICVEDLIHEIVTVGPAFKEANNFLWPFKLNSPLGGYADKGTHYSEGGDAGNRERDINKLVRSMN